MGKKIIYVFIGVTLSVVLGITSENNSQRVRAGPKLVIDHDGGSDDAMAIFMALLYEQYFDGPEIVALTTVHGNVPEPQVFENTQRILDIANRREVPFYRGSNSSLVLPYPTDQFFGIDGLGDLENVTYEPIMAQPGHAVIALIDLSKKYEGQLVVVSLGAVTNIALAIKLDPQFISRLSQLYVVAGNFYSSTYNKPQFNALMDVESYYVIAANYIVDKVTLIPSSPFSSLHNISMEWRLKTLGSINTTIMRAQNQFDQKIMAERSTWKYLDPRAMAMILNNALIKEQRCTNNSIILCGDSRGINTNEITDCEESNAKIAFPAHEEAFMTFLYNVFSAEL